MEVVKKHVIFLKENSWLCITQLQGGQDALPRFIYFCVDKIYKCTCSLEILYDKMKTEQEIEFSVGIILRSLLMDCILIQYLKYLTLQTEKEGIEYVRNEINKYSLLFIADGTSHIINDLYEQTDFDNSQKKEIAEKLAAIFPDVFEEKNGKPSLKSEFKLNIKSLHSNSEHPEIPTRNTVYNLYFFYSKYDHISHWSSLLGNNIEYSIRREKVDSSIVMVLFPPPGACLHAPEGQKEHGLTGNIIASSYMNL